MNFFRLREHIPHSKTPEQRGKGYEKTRICGRVDTNSRKHWRGEQRGEAHVYQADHGEGDPEGGIAL